MNYRTIDTAGQITAVITDQIQISNFSEIAKSIMSNNSKIEQVGFLQNRSFKMMGGELSINGLIAGAYLTGSSGKINGFNFTLQKDVVTLSLPKSIILEIDDDIVKLQGINYKVIPYLPLNNTISLATKNILIDLAKESLASGIIYYDNDIIFPLIYVPQTNTYVWEKACGSGSLAYSLITGQRQVTQPSNQIINLIITDKIITVIETVKEI